MNTITTYRFIFILSTTIIGWIWTYIYYKRNLSRTKKEKFFYIEKTQLTNNELHQLQKKLDEYLVLQKQKEREYHELYSYLETTKEKIENIEHWKNETKQLRYEKNCQIEINNAQKVELRELAIRLEETRATSEEKQTLLVQNEQYINVQLEHIANRIFENKGHYIDEKNQHNLQTLIAPLREQLEGLRRQVQEGLNQESRELHTLTHELHNLQKLNAQITEETLNLTRALKGDKKTQGTWGEIVLSHILNAAGLREGHEYDTQVNIKTEDNGRFQPDIIVHLPNSRDVVIDAKMTLVAYERYFNAVDHTEQEKAIKEHIVAIRGHLRNLHQKDYQILPGIRSLDYILMFIPIEPAFLLAINRKPELITEALNQNIMLVSPTTLLVALRTINNLWRYENQNRYAENISDRATRLYDKIRLFVDEMCGIGDSLYKAQHCYHQAMKKLSEGRGNLISQAETFRQMGVEIKRPINKELIEKSLLIKEQEK
ncbi:DNA recombination protein RmuC [Candidatus Erwinia haradaeae]|uniref:DNA recombination protein RmuC, partial n=1 Tax=Candidatus Erwinia haradaeae TaxID=1922217 RepID=A0A803GCX1_9GAMM|nr:DNA recombination protein RmuC [Candidatus Erwinia haradaeae]VFP88752.1 DNA recombination protein RmuC [Candidatus Erwinia haradaeae]